MPARRIEAGPLLALLGAAVLLVSLFLVWYQPDLTGWQAFELLDVVLAALAAGAGLGALTQLGVLDGPDPRALPWCCGAAFVLVIATLLNDPPAALRAEADTGLWLAVVAAVLLALGAVLTSTRVRISFDVEGRRRRVSPVDSRSGSRAASDEARRRMDADEAPSSTLSPRPRRASDDDADGDTDERPAYRMPFDPPDEEPLRPDEPWADPPPRREPDA